MSNFCSFEEELYIEDNLTLSQCCEIAISKLLCYITKPNLNLKLCSNTSKV